MMSKLLTRLYDIRSIYITGLLLAVGLALQSYYAPKKDFGTGDQIYTSYNNYLIFKNSFEHLTEEESLYIHYPKEQWDLYKYTPTFSLFMGVFNLFPDLFGLMLWNILNILILIWGISRLPLEDKRMMLWIFGFVFLELITSTQNTQSNALITGLVLAGYGLMTDRKFIPAIALIVFAAFIKPFAIFALIPLLFFPAWYQHFVMIIGFGMVYLLLPLIVTTGEYLIEAYSSWVDLLMMDHGDKIGYSVMGWLKTWFGLEVNKMFLLLLGLISLMVPLARFKYYQSKYFQLNYLALVLIWMVIFNHMAESPTFIIAVTGVAIWFFESSKHALDYILMGLVVVFTMLIATDLFPKSIRESIMEPYAIKGVSCILVYGKILWDLMTYESPRLVKKEV